MPSFNRVILVGNLTRDPQLKYLPSQTAVTDFGIAINRKYKTASGEQREEVCFVDVTAFGKTGETIQKFFTKGKPILIEGRLKFDSWDDKQTGQKRSKLSVIADSFAFIGGPREEGSEDSDRTAAQQQGRPQRAVGQRPAPAPNTPPYDENSEGVPEDDIPF